jgi:serine/threonine-protein kinase HipA
MDLKASEIIHIALDFGSTEVKVGRMAQSRNQIWFEYDPTFRESGMEISPLQIPLAAGVTHANYRPFEGLYGVFNDSLPDGWGRLLLDRALTNKGIAPQSLGALDRLAYVGRRGMGALVYYPEINLHQADEASLDLNTLADEMQQVLGGETNELLDHLYQLGGSSAGARPKIVAGYHPQENKLLHGQQALPEGFEHWLIKFPSSSDMQDIAMIEFAYAKMAAAAGIEMAETKLFQGSKGRMYFGTRRFDRMGTQRLHMHTISGLLQADHRIPNLDYAVIMNCTLRLNNDMREVEKLFRLAAFNVFAHNQDDHGKNFSFLMDSKGEWRFAPAYDLTFSYGPGGQHCTTVMQEGAAPKREHLLNLGELFSIKARAKIIDEVRDAVSRWPEFAKDAHVSKASTAIIQKVIN